MTTASIQTLSDALVFVASACFGLVFLRAIRDSYRARKFEKNKQQTESLQRECERLCKEVSEFPGPRLTSEYIPQAFDTEEDARRFGKRWSRGGDAAYWTKKIDANGRDEDHPHYDPAAGVAGLLYCYPALFFGLKAMNGDDAWFVAYGKARNSWLNEYVAYLRQQHGNR